MSTISQLKAQRFKSSETKRHTQDIKNLKSNHNKTYEKEVKKSEKSLTRMRDEYGTKVQNLKIELEQKLVSLRNRQKDAIMNENKRLVEEVENIKKTHTEQVGEIKISQVNEINELTMSHKKTLENAQQKFKQEKLKNETV